MWLSVKPGRTQRPSRSMRRVSGVARARAEGRHTVHVRAWLPLPAACESQSDLCLEHFSEPPAHVAAPDAPQRTAFWEADLAENRRFTARYSYTQTARYADPLGFASDPNQTCTRPSAVLWNRFRSASC